MIKLREAILVEGRYDVNTVRQVVDTVVLETGGFRIFNNKDQLKVIRRIAETRGLIVLTDSDGAGFVIRNYLKGALPQGRIKPAYVPDVAVLKALDLPQHMTANALLEFINAVGTRQQLCEILQSFSSGD